MLSTSIVMASYRRPSQLAKTLRRLSVRQMQAFQAELILVGSAPDDETEAVMAEYARQAPFRVTTLMAADPGFAHAQNLAVQASSGELIVFTDDDCYLDDNYLQDLHRRFDPKAYQYGMGEILLVNADDDVRVANTRWWNFPDRVVIPPRSIPGPGSIQGANMFFLRTVLDATGGLRQVGPRDNNDIMTALMASRAGFTGVLLRGPKVYHDHGRKAGSPEADRTMELYAVTSGAYFAQLAGTGHKEAFEFWKQSLPDRGPVDLLRLERELRAAADEIAWMRETHVPAPQLQGTRPAA